MSGTILLSIKSLVLWKLSSVDRPFYQYLDALLLQPAESVSCCFQLRSSLVHNAITCQQGSLLNLLSPCSLHTLQPDIKLID